MKKILLLAAIATGLTLTAAAQKGKGHSKHEKKENKEWKKDKDDDRYEKSDKEKTGIFGNDRHDDDQYGKKGKKKDKNANGKYSKNVPAKVREAFNRDYPNASNVSWTKANGDWTATFNGAVFGQKTVTYHANGERVDGTSTTTSPIRKAIGL